MYYLEERRQAVARGIFSMWASWAIAMAAVIVLIVIAPFVKAGFLPLIAIGLDVALLWIDRWNTRSAMPVCFRIGHIARIILLVTAAILIIVIPLMAREGAHEITGQPINPDSPLIPILVISPCALLVTLYFIIRRNNNGYCNSCRRRNGSTIDYGIVGTVYARETAYQTRMLALISLLLAIVEWAYYLLGYINVNLNSSDIYFFVGIPVLFYLITLIVFGIRYYNMWLHYCRNSHMEKAFRRYGTAIRYIFVSNDRILLRQPGPKIEAVYSDDLMIDTPLTVRLPYRDNLPLHEAIGYLRDNAPGIGSYDVRLLYVSRFPGLHNNIFHFVVYDADPSLAADHFKAEWVPILEVSRLIKANLTSTAFAAEIHRIYTIAMAWKTYDSKGRRLYPIKNYRPTFRLSDMKKWDVDYADDRWLDIAQLNQDSPFFTFRRFIRNIINTLD